MKKRSNSVVVTAIAAFLLTVSSVHADKILFVDAFKMYADKSTLMVEIGNYQDRFALKINFGYGLAAKSIGLVYKEELNEKNGAIFDNALKKLSEILNDPNANILRIEKELSKDLGLTFDTAVKESLIK